MTANPRKKGRPCSQGMARNTFYVRFGSRGIAVTFSATNRKPRGGCRWPRFRDHQCAVSSAGDSTLTKGASTIGNRRHRMSPISSSKLVAMNPLVTTSWLAGRLRDPGVVILDATLPPVGITPPVDTRASYSRITFLGQSFLISRSFLTAPHRCPTCCLLPRCFRVACRHLVSVMRWTSSSMNKKASSPAREPGGCSRRSELHMSTFLIAGFAPGSKRTPDRRWGGSPSHRPVSTPNLNRMRWKISPRCRG